MDGQQLLQGDGISLNETPVTGCKRQLFIEVLGKGNIEILPRNTSHAKASKVTQTSPLMNGSFRRCQPCQKIQRPDAWNRKLTAHEPLDPFPTSKNIGEETESGQELAREILEKLVQERETPFTIENYHLSKDHIISMKSQSSDKSNDISHKMVCSNSSCIVPQGNKAGKFELQIAELDRELERIRLECESIVSDKVLDGKREERWSNVKQRVRLVPRMGTRLSNQRQWQKRVADEMLPNDKWLFREQIGSFDSSDGNDLEKAGGDNSTSAYNTGDSSCSTPLTTPDNSEPDSRNDRLPKKKDSNTSQNDSFFSALSSNRKLDQNTPTEFQQNEEKLVQSASDVMPQVNKKFNNATANLDIGLHVAETKPSCRQTAGDTYVGCNDCSSNQRCDCRHASKMASNNLNSAQIVCAAYIDVMYTNRANLEHTIMVQQTLYDQKMRWQGRERKITTRKMNLIEKNQTQNEPRLEDREDDAFNASSFKETRNRICSSQKSETPMEWVVKRRSDGSRYISKRPVKRCQHKKQQKKTTKDPRSTLSTKDETINDVRINGRYCSREDSRRQVLTSCLHRQNKEEMLQEQQQQTDGQKSNSDESILPLRRHRQLMDNRRRNIFRVQEVLAVGNRDSARRACKPLLSVTTI